MNLYDEADEGRAAVRDACVQAHTKGGTTANALSGFWHIKTLRRWVAALSLSTGRMPPKFRHKNDVAAWLVKECTPSAGGNAK